MLLDPQKLQFGPCSACGLPMVRISDGAITCIREEKSRRVHACPVGEFPTAGDVRWFKENERDRLCTEDSGSKAPAVVLEACPPD